MKDWSASFKGQEGVTLLTGTRPLLEVRKKEIKSERKGGTKERKLVIWVETEFRWKPSWRVEASGPGQ